MQQYMVGKLQMHTWVNMNRFDVARANIKAGSARHAEKKRAEAEDNERLDQIHDAMTEEEKRYWEQGTEYLDGPPKPEALKPSVAPPLFVRPPQYVDRTLFDTQLRDINRRLTNVELTLVAPRPINEAFLKRPRTDPYHK